MASLAKREEIPEVRPPQKDIEPPPQADPERTLDFPPVMKLAGFVFNPPKDCKMHHLTRFCEDGYYWIDVLICDRNCSKKERKNCKAYNNFFKEKKD